MLLVPHRLGPSLIHGLGVFATQVIEPGSPIWTFQVGFDQEFKEDDVRALPASALQHVSWFGFQSLTSGLWVLSADLGCFMNHSPTPNTGVPQTPRDPFATVALRRIDVGDELTCDYFAFDRQAASKLAVADQGCASSAID